MLRVRSLLMCRLSAHRLLLRLLRQALRLCLRHQIPVRVQVLFLVVIRLWCRLQVLARVRARILRHRLVCRRLVLQVCCLVRVLLRFRLAIPV
jgi:hypothetical protein